MKKPLSSRIDELAIQSEDNKVKRQKCFSPMSVYGDYYQKVRLRFIGGFLTSKDPSKKILRKRANWLGF